MGLHRRGCLAGLAQAREIWLRAVMKMVASFSALSMEPNRASFGPAESSPQPSCIPAFHPFHHDRGKSVTRFPPLSSPTSWHWIWTGCRSWRTTKLLTRAVTTPLKMKDEGWYPRSLIATEPCSTGTFVSALRCDKPRDQSLERKRERERERELHPTSTMFCETSPWNRGRDWKSWVWHWSSRATIDSGASGLWKLVFTLRSDCSRNHASTHRNSSSASPRRTIPRWSRNEQNHRDDIVTGVQCQCRRDCQRYTHSQQTVRAVTGFVPLFPACCTRYLSLSAFSSSRFACSTPFLPFSFSFPYSLPSNPDIFANPPPSTRKGGLRK